MRHAARMAFASAGSAALTAALFCTMGLMNLAGSEPEAPSARPLYRPIMVRRAQEPPRAPRKAPAPKAEAKKPDAPSARHAPPSPARTGSSDRKPVESRLRALPAPGIGGNAVPAPEGLFDPKVFETRDSGLAETPLEAKPDEGTYTVRDLDRPPEVASSTRPEYPSWAAERNVTGSVTLKFLVTREGVPEDVMVTEWTGDEEFADSAKRALRQWRFKPGSKGGKPVAFWCRITIRFEQ